MESKYPSWTPYSYVIGNPVIMMDTGGKDWFYYQAQGEEEKTWHFREGNSAVFKNVDGKYQYTKDGFDMLVKFTITGRNKEGADVGKMDVYSQNEIVLTVNGVFSGNSNFGSTAPIPSDTYMMLLDKRDADGPPTIKPDGTNPVSRSF